MPSEISGPGTVTGSYDLIGDPNSAGGLTNGTNGNIVGQNGSPIPLATIFAVDANGNPVLGTYGGTTGVQTFALVPGSPAINAGSTALAVVANGNPLSTDARGLPRVVGGGVDIGAFQNQGYTLTVTGGNSQTTLAGQPFARPLTVSVTANNGVDPVNGGLIAFAVPAGGAFGRPVRDLGHDRRRLGLGDGHGQQPHRRLHHHGLGDRGEHGRLRADQRAATDVRRPEFRDDDLRHPRGHLQRHPGRRQHPPGR